MQDDTFYLPKQIIIILLLYCEWLRYYYVSDEWMGRTQDAATGTKFRPVFLHSRLLSVLSRRTDFNWTIYDNIK